MPRPDLDRLRDMLEAAQKAASFCGNSNRDDFDHDPKTQFAVVRCLEIIGEAAWRISDITKRSLPEVHWPRIANMRHRLIHDYFQVNLDIVWSTVRDDLPVLVSQIKPFLDAIENADD